MGETTLRDDAIVALRRFSSLGHRAVALVVLTGIGNTALILGIFFLQPYANGFWSIVSGLDDVWQKRNAIVQSTI